MTVRLYFLVPNEDAAVEVVKGLKEQSVSEDDIYAVANRTHYPLDERVPDAGLLERTDLKNAAKRGASIGGTAGLFAGLAAITLNPLGLVAAGGALIATTLAGAAAGTWTSTLVGVSVPNSDLQEFQDAIDKGNILMLVDVEGDDKAQALKNTLATSFPSLVIKSGELETSSV